MYARKLGDGEIGGGGIRVLRSHDQSDKRGCDEVNDRQKAFCRIEKTKVKEESPSKQRGEMARNEEMITDVNRKERE